MLSSRQKSTIIISNIACSSKFIWFTRTRCFFEKKCQNTRFYRAHNVELRLQPQHQTLCHKSNCDYHRTLILANSANDELMSIFRLTAVNILIFRLFLLFFGFLLNRLLIGRRVNLGLHRCVFLRSKTTIWATDAKNRIVSIINS